MTYYIDTSVWVAYTFAREREKERFREAERLVEMIDTGQIQASTSIYALIELYQIGIDNFDDFKEGSDAEKEAIIAVLETKVILLPMLDRKEKLIYGRMFVDLEDSSDIPHAISAYLYGCDGIVAYDRHFDRVHHLLCHFVPQDVDDDES